MIVLVCGGRNYTDYRRVFAVLDELHKTHGIEAVIHGAASGADEWADGWATRHSRKNRRYPAKWKDLSHPDAVIRGRRGHEYDATAGWRRNQHMLDVHGHEIDLVVAFPGNRGTKDMIRRAKAAGIKVMEVKP